MIDTLWQDIRFALVLLYKNLKFTTVIVLCLALGIGPNTTIFSLINLLLLSPLDIHEPERMISVAKERLERTGSDAFTSLSYPELEWLDRDLEHLTGVIAVSGARVSAGWQRGSKLVSLENVSANFFDVLGKEPLMGETFHARRNAFPGSMPFAVLGYNFWEEDLGADPDIVGTTLKINGFDFKVVAVMPKTFTGAMVGFQPAIWVPLPMIDQTRPDSTGRLEERGHNWLQAYGRLRPESTMAMADRELRRWGDEYARQFPETNDRRTFRAQPFTNISIAPENVLNSVAAMMMAVVGLVLLVACASMAALLLARATERRREIAVRLALGARRSRIIAQLLTESVIMSLLAGALALLTTFWTMDLLLGLLRDLPLTLSLNPKLDHRVLGFTLLISILTGILFGLVPALRISKPDLISALKDQPIGDGSEFRTSRLRNLFMTAQFALSVVLLIIAGLFVRGLIRAGTIDPGFEHERMLVFGVPLGLFGYSHAEAGRFGERLRQRLADLPGIEAVGTARHEALSFFDATSFYVVPLIDGLETGDPRSMDYSFVGPEYFETVEIPILQGRAFRADDRKYINPVCIVNERFAEQFWPNENPIGKRMFVSGVDDAVEVVGVARDAKYRTLGEEPRTFMYLPMYESVFHRIVFHLRTSGEPRPMVDAVRQEIAAMDPNLPLSDVQPMSEHLSLILWPARMAAMLFGAFGLLALILAVIGVYGVISYGVHLRKREIGIRLALGGPPRAIVNMVMARGLAVVGLGTALGVGAALAATQLFKDFLNGVSPTDPAVFTIVPLFLCATGFLAVFLPARRSVKMEPMTALRYE